ncbi:MAG: hypothetical protein VX290_19335 [Candidatus Latescibacterota bacterium]|nr:hypothetical protein [Candidatus Latescibacterota bacterium]
MTGIIERFLVDTHLWVAGGAAGLVLFSQHALGLPVRGAPVGLVAASTLLIYRFDGWVDADRPSRGVVPVVMALAVLIWSWGQAPQAVRWLVGLGTIPCVLYGSRWGGGDICLRQVPGVKPFFVTGALTVATIGVTVLWSSGEVTLSQLCRLSLLLGILLLSNVTLFDLRDERADRARQIVTLPVLFGPTLTRWGVAGLCLASCVGLALAGDVFIGTHAETAIVIALSSTAFCVGHLNPNGPRFRYAICVDGIPLLLGVSAWMLPA